MRGATTGCTMKPDQVTRETAEAASDKYRRQSRRVVARLAMIVSSSDWLRRLSFSVWANWWSLIGERFNPLDQRVVANPHPVYRRLRNEDPVHWNPILQGWMVTRYDDVLTVLNGSRFSADRQLATNPLLQAAAERQERLGPVRPSTTMLSSDPPEHSHLRRLVSKAFTPRMVDEMRPFIQVTVDELLASVVEAGRFDIVQSIAHELPVAVIAEMLGLPGETRHTLKRWSDSAVEALDGPFAPAGSSTRSLESSHEMAHFFRERLSERQKRPAADLLSALATAEEHGEILTEDEMVATCILLLVAGNETTSKLLGNGMLALLRNPKQLERLLENPSLIPLAVEELLRYDGPAQLTGRVAIEDLEIGGKRIRAGQLVVAVLAAANRDPSVFSDPDHLDISRQPNPHLAFGDGVHFCLGAPLARAEVGIAISTMLRELPNLRLAAAGPVWGSSFILRGLRSLPVAFDQRPQRQGATVRSSSPQRYKRP